MRRPCNEPHAEENEHTVFAAHMRATRIESSKTHERKLSLKVIFIITQTHLPARVGVLEVLDPTLGSNPKFEALLPHVRTTKSRTMKKQPYKTLKKPYKALIRPHKAL